MTVLHFYDNLNPVRPDSCFGTYANSADPFRCHKMWRLNRISTVCLQKFLCKIQLGEKIHQKPLKLEMDSPNDKDGHLLVKGRLYSGALF